MSCFETSCCDKIITPSSTPEWQIFPLGKCSSTYQTGDYDPEFADNKASHEEVTQVINAIQLARQPFVRRKWLMNTLVTFAWLILISIAVFIRIFFFGTTSILGLIVMVVFFTLSTAAVDDIYKKKEHKINEESKNACYKVLDDQYKDSFGAKGLRWFLPAHFPRWVELQKIGAHGNQETAQPIYVPPAMH